MVSLDHLTPAECISLEYYFRYKRLLRDSYCESPCRSVCLSKTLKLHPSIPSLYQLSLKEVPRGDQYGKLTMRHQRFRKYVSPNQTCLFS